MNQFSELVGAIKRLTPPPSRPSHLAPKDVCTVVRNGSPDEVLGREVEKAGKWSPLLTGHIAGRAVTGRKVDAVYSPLQVKKTKFVPNSKKYDKKLASY